MIARFARPLLVASAAASLAAFGTAASAQGAAVSAQAKIMPGMQVVDPAGNAVGTVTAVKGANLIVKTDRHEVQLPATSFTPNKGKLLFAMTQAQLNAATDAAMAKAQASIAVGANVHGTGGQVAGTIEKLEPATVTLKLTSGELVRLPRNAIAPSANGVVLGVTVEELKAMASAATSSEPATATNTETTEPEAGQAPEPTPSK